MVASVLPTFTRLIYQFYSPFLLLALAIVTLLKVSFPLE